ncbi:MAG: holin family protein [Pseudomonadota bacterium]
MGIDLTGIGSVADLASGILDKVWPDKMSGAERAEAELAVQRLIQDRENRVVDAKAAIMVAEINQSDNYTKRARPSIVYMGLAFIGLVHVLLPMIAWIVLISTGKPLTDMPSVALPGEFWAAWGGVCSVWVIGRTLEKKGAGGLAGKAAGLITGGIR